MRVLLQWTKAHPEDFLEVDVRPTGQFRRAWERLAAKALPTGGETIDDNPGWICGLNIQGVWIGGFDHYAGEPIDDPTYGWGIRIYMWNDDPTDWPVGTRNARIWEFYDPASDPRLDGVTNTRQFLKVYDERPEEIARYQNVETSGGPVEVHPYSDFVVPTTTITRHGIWMSDQLWNEHRNVRSNHGWREWIA